MTTPLRRPKRNKGGGKLDQERERAGVGGADPSGASGIHSLDPEEGELFECDPADISPNPMNRRLDLRNMDEMIASVKRQGVHTPGAVMHTSLFMEKYPEWADQVPHPECTYILGPGHRRHAAALKAVRPMLVILRNNWAKELRVEENLISENNDRDGLSPIEQALQLDLLRRRSMTGDEIAERSGYGNRGTVSRYLNLLDLPQEIQDEIHEGLLSQKAGYALSTIKDDNEANDSPAAHKLQLQARGWMRDEGIPAEAAKNRLKLKSAFPTGNKQKTDAPPTPRTETNPVNADSNEPAPVSRGKRDDGDQSAGEPDRDDTKTPNDAPIPHQPDGSNPASTDSNNSKKQEPTDPEPSPAEEAAKARDFACRLLLAEEKYAGAADVSTHLVNAVLNPDEWKQAAARAHSWLHKLDKGPSLNHPNQYVADVAASGDANLMRRVAFAIALAADEVRAAKPDREWDDRDHAHVQFLVTSKAAYQPTEWEQEQLGLVSRGKQ